MNKECSGGAAFITLHYFGIFYKFKLCSKINLMRRTNETMLLHSPSPACGFYECFTVLS